MVSVPNMARKTEIPSSGPAAKFDQSRRSFLKKLPIAVGTSVFGVTALSAVKSLAAVLSGAQIANREFKAHETIFEFSWGRIEMDGVGTTGKFYGLIQVDLAAKNNSGQEVGRQINVTEGKFATLFIQKDGIFANMDGAAADGFSCLISGQPLGKADIVNGTLYTISCSGGNPSGQTATLRVTSQAV